MGVSASVSQSGVSAGSPAPLSPPPGNSEGEEFVLQNQALLIPVCSHEKLPLIPGTNTAFSELRLAVAASIAPFHIPSRHPAERPERGHNSGFRTRVS